MLDVAREAGVSLKTVSRVVNGEPAVRPETSQRVERAMAALGFRRNDSARQLRTGRTASVGLVVEDLADPFYSLLTKAVARVCEERGHLLLSGSAEGSPERERSLVSAFLARRVDGLVVVPALADDHGWLAGEGVPFVLVDRPAGGTPCDSVLSDNAGGVRAAVEHLAGRGHRRIGFLGDDAAFWTAQQRRRGFLEAVDALGLPAADLVGMGPHTVASAAALLEGWGAGADPLTAVVTGNNRVTVTALRALRDAGRRLEVVGFDDVELADLLDPPLTVVAQDPERLGDTAARLLFRRMGGDLEGMGPVVVPTRLVVRG
ncbi:LacI family DNA-binding transcriptional regulator [Vallicoccus soli]|uniref:LacI family transcriptional regulator n=1 Tax=Vallicoccus soli TaxID=2339232 RepID=A0A3A3Z0U7_9ACTN|nr:LacI family transcriptional regulator [Vallicoccus soli]